MSLHKRLNNNEDGFILIVTMLILVVLTLIGISATRNSTLELQISGNERWYKQTFYGSESGWQQGLQTIEAMASAPDYVNPNDNDDMVDELTSQTLGNIWYEYSTDMIQLTGNQRRVAGSSGLRGWQRFRFLVSGLATGPLNSTHQSDVLVEKPFDTGS